MEHTPNHIKIIHYTGGQYIGGLLNGALIKGREFKGCEFKGGGIKLNEECMIKL